MIFQLGYPLTMGYVSFIIYYHKIYAMLLHVQIAQTTFSIITYNTLTNEKAKDNYQTFGQLFEQVSKNWLIPTQRQR